MSESKHPTPQQQELIWRALSGLAGLVLVLLVLAGLGLVLYGVLFFQNVLIPLALAAVIAFMLDPLVEWLMRWGMSRNAAVVYVFLLVAVLFIGLVAFVLPRLYLEVVRISYLFPNLINWIELKWKLIYERHHGSNWWVQGDEVMNWLREKGPVFAKEAAQWLWQGVDRLFSAVSLLIGLAVVPLYVFYFLFEKPAIKANWRRYIPLRKSRLRDETVDILSEIRKYLEAFFHGQLINAVVLGTCATIGLSLAGVNSALLLGVMTGMLSLIPYLGVIASAGTAITVAYFQAGCWWWGFKEPGNWWFVLVVGAIYGLVHWCESWFITPRIQGKYTGLHPMTIIVSVLAWSLVLGGVLGALLAVPLTASLKVLMFRYVWGEDISQKQNQEKS